MWAKLDVRVELLEPTESVTRCPYKGVARYWSAQVGVRLVKDIVWSYAAPIPECPKIENLLSIVGPACSAMKSIPDRYFPEAAARDSVGVIATAAGEEQGMTTATWNGATIAESDKTVVVEGNHYFPPRSVRKEFLQASSTTSRCPWKGTARYYSLVVDGKTNKDAAWYYPEPATAAANIKDYMAFWNGVDVR
jgi:uncharacterized protein (DUF427 family)